MRIKATCAAAAVTALATGSAYAPEGGPAIEYRRLQAADCMRECRATFTSIEEVLRLIEQAEKGGEAEVLEEIRGRLVDMRQQMSRCMVRLEGMSGSGQAREASPVSGVWSCPMHPQIRQDKPGNCPVCDGTLRPLSAWDPTSQPAVAALPSGRVNYTGTMRAAGARNR